MEGVNDFVNVAVRIRPLLKNEVHSNLKVFYDNPSTLCILDRQQTYSFDNIFDETADQNAVFSTTIRPMIDKLLLGYNCTVFAYGQTGTGKTYTMGNPQTSIIDDDMGMIGRTFQELFDNINDNLEMDVEVSLYEIYNEKVYDLLGDTKVALPVKGFSVYGLRREPVNDLSTAEDLIHLAGKNRHTAGTRQNANSSRSHAIYTLYCSIRTGDMKLNSKFNFVDLAGSESVRRTGNEGQQFFEGININKGLLCIGQVINALSTKKNYVPYRQSIITTLLQDSLNRKNNITLMACISPDPSDSTETIQTLEFAKNAKRVMSRPEVNTAVNNFLKTNPFLSSVKKRPNPSIETPRYATPMKRMQSFQTSTVMRNVRPLHSTLIEQYAPLHRNSNESERFSTPALNISGVSAIHEAPPPINYSPIVRRCVDMLESTLLSKIDLLIKENTRHLVRRSPRLSRNLWKGCDVTASIRDENASDTVLKITNISNTKSPAERALRDITLIQTEPRTPRMEGGEQSDDDRKKPTEPTPNFKIPYVPVERLSAKFMGAKTSSPLVGVEEVPNNELSGSNCSVGMPSFFRNEETQSSAPLRRSVRLSMRVATRPDCHYAGTIRTSQKFAKKRTSNHKQSDTFIPPKKQKGDEDTATLHTNHVLKLLNTGTVKNLQTLHTVGLKTAQQIVLYRDLRGQYTEIKDLKKVLTKGRGYDRFVQSNFLLV